MELRDIKVDRTILQEMGQQLKVGCLLIFLNTFNVVGVVGQNHDITICRSTAVINLRYIYVFCGYQCSFRTSSVLPFFIKPLSQL